jgi:hypothetical protein
MDQRLDEKDTESVEVSDNDDGFEEAENQELVRARLELEETDALIRELQERRVGLATRIEQLEAQKYQGTWVRKEKKEDDTEPVKLEPTIINLVSDSEEDVRPAGGRWKGKGKAIVESEPSSPDVKPIPQPSKGKGKAVPASLPASESSTLPVIIAGGDFYWQLTTPAGTVGKRQGDHCMNATQIVDFKGYSQGERDKEMAALRTRLNGGIWEMKTGSGSKVVGTWIAFEDAVTLIEKLGLSEQLKALVDVDGFPMPVLASPPATLKSDSVYPFSYQRRDMTVVSHFLKVETSLGPISRKLDNDWINVTQIISAAGASKHDWTSLRPRYEKGIRESIAHGPVAVQGLYVPHKKAIQIAAMWGVESLIAPLVSDLEEPIEGEDEDDVQVQSNLIKDLKPGEFQYTTVDRKTYSFTTTGTRILTKRVEDDWLNATQILNLAALNRSQVKHELRLIRQGAHASLMRGGVVTGTYIPWHRGVRLAKDKKVFDQLRVLIGDVDSDDEEEEDEGPDESSYWERRWQDIDLPDS